MRIKVIIVTYNGENLIPQCLNRLRDSLIKLEVIVIDNASSDKTVSIITKKYPEVKLIKNAYNQGFGRANNIGLKIALQEKADYVFLLNQDAYIEPDTIKNLIDIHQKNPKYGVLSPLHINKNNYLDEKFSALIFSENNKIFQDYLLNQNKAVLYEVNWVNAAAWLLPLETLKNIGGFNPVFFMYGEDGDYCKRVKYHGYKIGIYINSKIVHTRCNDFFKNHGFWKNLKRDITDVKQYYNEQYLSLNYTVKQNLKSEIRHFYSHIIQHIAFLKLRNIVTYSLGFSLFLFNIRKIKKLRKQTLEKNTHFINS